MSALPSPATGSSPRQRMPSTAKTMSIGMVIQQLKPEFPEVTVSKIRFLESEGLISPQRTASGYRRFTHDDLARLRYILTAQRDNYLPLKIIREQLAAMDSGAVTPLRRSEPALLVSAEDFKSSTLIQLSLSELARQASMAENEIAELCDANIIAPNAAGFFSADDLAVVTTVRQLKEYGIDSRHIRSLKNAAERQADLISRVAVSTGKTQPNGRERAEEMTRQMMALVVSIHANFVKMSLQQNG